MEAQGNSSTAHDNRPIYFPKYVLYPPNPNDVNPTTSGKRSTVVSVNGLPRMMIKQDIKDLFEGCGPIVHFLMNDATSCYIEYFDDFYAKKATLFSGYTIKIGDKDGLDFAGFVLVKFFAKKKFKKVLSESTIVPCNKHERNIISAKLGNLDTLSEAAEILADWLKKNKCTVNNADDFYIMLKTASVTANALVKEQEACQEKIKNAEKKFNCQMSGLSADMNELGRVFTHAKFDDMLKNFDEPEQQNLLQWREEFLQASQEVDAACPKKKGANCSTKSHSNGNFVSEAELLRLKAEKEDLQLQLDCAQLSLQNERSEHAEGINVLDQLYREAQQICDEYEAKILDYRACQSVLKNKDSETESYDKKITQLNSLETRLICTISTFLSERPSGATLGNVRTYLRKNKLNVTGKNIAELMRRFPNIFKEESVGIGPAMTVKWMYIGEEP